MSRLFKFHATSVARNHSPTPNNAIKCQSNRLSDWSAQIIPRKFGLLTELINQIFVYHSPTDAAPQFLQKLIPFTQIIPVFFVLCSLGKFRLSISCKMPIISQSTTCKVFNMGDVITPSHLRQLSICMTAPAHSIHLKVQFMCLNHFCVHCQKS